MEKQTNTKRMIGSVVGAVAGVLIAVVIQQQFFKVPSFDKMLMKVASELNESCPMMVDGETRLDNAITLPEKIFQYNYTLVNLPIDSIDIQGFVDYMRPQILNNVKTNPDLKLFRENEVTMSYYYKDSKGTFVSKIIITPDQYSE